MGQPFYAFPTQENGLKAIEETVLDLEKKLREGMELDPEVVDWLSFANTVLDQGK